MSKEKRYPKTHYDMCVACGVCTGDCPFGCLSLESNVAGKDKVYKMTAFPVLDESKCTSCGICEKACPIEAITML